MEENISRMFRDRKVDFEKLSDIKHLVIEGPENNFDITDVLKQKKRTDHLIIITRDIKKWKGSLIKWTYEEGRQRISELFHYDYFVTNPTEFYLSPLYERVKDTKTIYEAFDIVNPDEEWAIMFNCDPIARWYDFRQGDLIKIDFETDRIDYQIVLKAHLWEIDNEWCYLFE